MDEDKLALVEKIIKDIDNVMLKNAELCAFDIVPVDSNFQNKSPVLHLEYCLGLESWCVKHVYMYCYTELVDKYVSKQKRKNIKLTSMHSEQLARLLNVVLLLNPDLSTFWNKRREMVLKCFFEKSSELRFTRLVLSRKPKCNDVFAYRRWLLDLILKVLATIQSYTDLRVTLNGVILDSESIFITSCLSDLDESLQVNNIQDLINEELHVCELAADKSPNNYHSWSHRMWLVKTLKEIRRNFDIHLLYIKEYLFSERWTSKHVSDFSCFHYRQFCIINIFAMKDDTWKSFQNSLDTNLRKNFVRVLAQNFPKDLTIEASEEDLVTYSEDSLMNLLLSYTSKSCNCVVNNTFVCRKLEILYHELVLNNELLQFYKYHETLWYHRRFIIHEVIATIYDYFGLIRQNGALIKNICSKCNTDVLRQKQVKIVRYDSQRIYSSVLFNILISHEKKFIEDRQSDSDNYADRHEKYMKFVEGLNNVM